MLVPFLSTARYCAPVTRYRAYCTYHTVALCQFVKHVLLQGPSQICIAVEKQICSMCETVGARTKQFCAYLPHRDLEKVTVMVTITVSVSLA